MTVQQENSNNSDDSEDMVSLPTENDIYRRKYLLLLERCEVLHQDNERIVNRIHEAKKITRRYRKDVKLLMERLDRHGDAFRTVTTDSDPKLEVITRPGRVPAKHPVPSKSVDKPSASKKVPVKRKPKAEKPEKDPNAPKKPCNAFFQFCQEQRPLVIAETSSDIGGDLSKKEVTRQLASRWRALSNEDKKESDGFSAHKTFKETIGGSLYLAVDIYGWKDDKVSPKVYVAMFERSKEKYAEEMSAYVKKEQ